MGVGNQRSPITSTTLATPCGGGRCFRVRYSRMRILITGGAGFIGSNFVRYWRAQHPDDQIVVFDVLTYAGHRENIADLLDGETTTLLTQDITDREAVFDATEGIDVIVHFAAESHVDRSIIDPGTFIQTNVAGTQILLDAAREHKIKRFHHVSTDEVYGSLELESDERFTENSPIQPRSPYAASKAASDLLVQAYHHTYDLPVTITNTSNNYGPYQFPEKLIPLMILNALADKPLPVYGDGLNVRDWIHVEDHCRGIELILKKGTPGETYCIGGDNEVANIDVVKSILTLLDKPESLISYVTDRLGHDRRYAIDSAKINRLGFTLKHTFESGLKDTVEWYTTNRDYYGSH